MTNRFLYFFFIIFICINFNKLSAKSSNGNGEVFLAQNTLQAFYEYNSYKKGIPMFFALHPTGKFYQWSYCEHKFSNNCVQNEYPELMRKCAKRAEENGESGRCYIFARKNKIVWNNLSNPNFIKVSKKISRDDLIALLLKNNFLLDDIKTPIYDKDNPNNNEKLKSLQKLLDQGALTQSDFDKEKKKILKNTNTKEEKKQTSNKTEKNKKPKEIIKSDIEIVSKLKDLKELLDTGVLTQEEFEIAKKKLLN